MSSNTDRRVNRTKLALRRALLELIAKGDYDTISIQDVVNQADVGRSTFTPTTPTKRTSCWRTWPLWRITFARRFATMLESIPRSPSVAQPFSMSAR